MLPIDHRVSPVLRHTPLHPPRKSVPREGLYLMLWQQFATQRPQEWRYIFRTNGPVRQRAASVAASFMVYMGCNAGRAFTHSAEKMTALIPCPEDAYLAAWAIENKRLHGFNSGLRTIEYMLSREHPVTLDTGRSGTDWGKVPNVSMEDMDIVESMVAWWSGPTAHWMREAVEAQIKASEVLQTGGLAV